MDQKLHVGESELLNAVLQMFLLIHALDEAESSGPHLNIKGDCYYTTMKLINETMNDRCLEVNLFFFVRAEVQKDIEVLVLSGGTFEDKLL